MTREDIHFHDWRKAAEELEMRRASGLTQARWKEVQAEVEEKQRTLCGDPLPQGPDTTSFHPFLVTCGRCRARLERQWDGGYPVWDGKTHLQILHEQWDRYDALDQRLSA